ncbi:hypothetical protein [Azospirillum brasilense]|uniref:hypothetical protein n=1 Tax=Azospirillum brasilense TaxID=192 RepID=UPI000E682B7D|nr:hypothetical protein [Azospirillum brasilense]NUB24248.1 hypothetical protein [Azospirillum brasilense]NUB30140.1 hypothetical protein [Azospirillum brasilense]RIW04994.1 hypothetical protein D2T81_09200 [Azospirillum brasilense]
MHAERSADLPNPARSADHVLRRLEETPLCEDPFPHLVVPDALPADLYARAVAQWPKFEALALLQMDTLPQRHQMVLTDRALREMEPEAGAVWREVRDCLFGPKTLKRLAPRFPSLAAKLETPVAARPATVYARLVEDHAGHAMLPHTDVFGTFLSMLLYMPADGRRPDLGTALYRPRDPSFSANAGRSTERFPRADFELAGTAPFLPNHLLAYAPSDRSFHGVEPVEAPCVRRFLLLFAVMDSRGP